MVPCHDNNVFVIKCVWCTTHHLRCSYFVTLLMECSCQKEREREREKFQWWKNWENIIFLMTLSSKRYWGGIFMTHTLTRNLIITKTTIVLCIFVMQPSHFVLPIYIFEFVICNFYLWNKLFKSNKSHCSVLSTRKDYQL